MIASIDRSDARCLYCQTRLVKVRLGKVLVPFVRGDHLIKEPYGLQRNARGVHVTNIGKLFWDGGLVW